MLLPSAIACDAFAIEARPSRPSRPKMHLFNPYQPLSTVSQSAPVSAIASSCRTLQAMLGCPSSTKSSVAVLSHQSGSRRNEIQDPFGMSCRLNGRRAPPAAAVPRGKNKRSRDEFEIEADKENDVMDYETSEQYSTPKRQRRAPLLMPLGLSAEDFNALEPSLHGEDELTMPSFASPTRDSDEDSGYGPSPMAEDSNWTLDDDRILVEMVLEKLKLSKREWNDCAKKLGKNRDSIGRRWGVLVGEGNVGLRRGRRISRTSLEIGSW